MESSVPSRTHRCTTIQLRLTAAALLASCSLLRAQTAPPPRAPAGEDVIELSPFVVGAEKDNGYVATSSLAGTRIRTDLKDLANPISVVTREFLEDVNATDPVSLLVYTANTEAGGAGGNYAGAVLGSPATFTGPIREPQNNNRVRGLARADLTRDYFPTGIVFDSFNTSRVEVNRGPNATLFGLGSPGGIINNQSSRPTLKNAASAELNWGSYGTTREVLDIDRVLVPKQLALRVIGLNEREQYRQDFAYQKDRRLYASLYFSPFKGGVLRASYEKGAIDANRPRQDAPRNNLTRWWTTPFNKVTHSPATDDYTLVTGSSKIDLLRGFGEWFSTVGVVYEDNYASTPARAMYAWNKMTGVPNVPGGKVSTPFQANMLSITKGDQWFASPTAAALGIKHGGFYTDDTIGDFSIFDWRKQLMDGPNKKEWEDFNVGNISYEQNFKFALGSVGAEVALNREHVTRSYFDMFPAARGYQISIDVNTTLPWGAPNPNFGRPFLASNNTRHTADDRRKTDRLTAYLELDFARNTDRFKWLGRHNFTGYANRFILDEKDYTSSNTADIDWVRTVRAGATNPDYINNADGIVRNLVYIGPNLASLKSPEGIHLQGVQTVLQPGTTTGYYWDATAKKYQTHSISVNDVLNDKVFYNTITDAALNQQKITSKAFVYQAHLLKEEWIVGTIGWRNDRARYYANNGNAGSLRDANNFVNIHDPAFVLPSTADATFEESTWSHGIVVHRPPFLPFIRGADFSVHYSKSENFQPADARIDIFGQSIQPPGGTTEDRGFSLSFFEGKLQTRFNWYETESARASFGYLSFLIETDARIVRYNTPAALAAAGWQGPPQFLKDLVGWRETSAPNNVSGVGVSFKRPDNMSDTQSTTSKGFEFESTYNPLPNWRIAFNASQQKAMRADIGPATKAYLALRVPEWTTGKTGDLVADESAMPVKKRVYETLLNETYGNFAREGQTVAELRKWRFNLVTNYMFPAQSKLKGWSIGGAARWQDKIAIGYPIIDAPNPGGGTIELPDLAHPYYGPTDVKYDGWVGYSRRIWHNKVRWKVQLNVRNLMNQDEMVPVMAQPDGSIAAWMAPQGRTFNLRSTFEF